jgi:hypothetical protein
MKVFSRVTIAVLAGALITVAQDVAAQSRRAEDVRRAPVSADDRRWDRDNDRDRRDRDRDDRWDRDDDRRRRDNDRWRNDDNRRRISNAEWQRRQRMQHIEWCRRHRNDRRCADLYRRNGNWCWDRNYDRRCDYVDYRRYDSRGVMRADRGPDWERWLRSSGVDVEALLNQQR